MAYVTQWVDKQGQWLLTHKRQAILCAMLFALLPYFVWLSVTILSLVTLRQGKRAGLVMLIPVMLVYFGMLQSNMPIYMAITNVLLVYVPCYIAASVLRYSISWRIVAMVFFLQTLILVIGIHAIMPGFIMAYYTYIRSMTAGMQQTSILADWLNNFDSSQLIVANYVLGVQLVSIAVATLIPLLIARGIQARLFNPNGLKQELYNFRMYKEELIVLLFLFIASMQQYVFAINLFPLAVFYFTLAGLSVSAYLLNQKQWHGAVIILFVPLFLLPVIILPAYAILGVVDSIFNFRSTKR